MMDSGSSDSTEGDDNQNGRFNRQQIQELLKCLNFILNNIVRVLPKIRRESITEETKESKKSVNISITNSNKLRTDIQDFCRKIHDIGNFRSTEAVVPGTSVSGTGDRQKTDCNERRILNSKTSTTSTEAALPLSSRSHTKAAVSASSKSRTEPVLPLPSENCTKTAVPTSSRIHNTAAVSASSKSRTEPVLPLPSENCTKTAVPKSSKSHTKDAVPSPSKRRTEPVLPLPSENCTKTAVPKSSKSHTKDAVPSPSKRRTELVLPLPSENCTKTAVPKSSKSHTKDAVPASSKSRTEAVLSLPSENRTETVVPTSSRSHTKDAVPASSKSCVGEVLPSSSENHSITAVPATSTSHTKAALSACSKNSREAVLPSSSRNHTETVSENSKNQIEASKSHTETSAGGTEEVTPIISRDHREASISNIPRYNTEKISVPRMNNKETKIHLTSRDKTEVLIPMSKGHREEIFVETSKLNKIAGDIPNTDSDYNKRRKNQKIKMKHESNISDNKLDSKYKRRKHGPTVTTNVNANIREDILRQEECMDLRRSSEPKLVLLNDNAGINNTAADGYTKSNLKRNCTNSNDDNAKSARIYHKCPICRKSTYNVENHCRNKHNICHEIKHNKKHYKTKMQDLCKRLKRPINMDINIKKANSDERVKKKELADSETGATINNTMPNKRIEGTIADLTHPKTDIMTDTMENSGIKKCNADTIDLTSDDDSEVPMNVAINVTSPKLVKDDQIFNPQATGLGTLPENKIKYESGNLSAVDLIKDKNIEEYKNKLMEELEIKFAENLLAAAIKKEQATNNEQDNNNIVHSAFFTESNSKTLNEERDDFTEKNPAQIQQLRKPHDIQRTHTDKVTTKSEFAKLNSVNKINDNKHIHEVTITCITPKVPVKITGSKTGEPIQPGYPNSIENQTSNTSTAKPQSGMSNSKSEQHSTCRVGVNFTSSTKSGISPSSTKEPPSRKKSPNTSRHLNTDSSFDLKPGANTKPKDKSNLILEQTFASDLSISILPTATYSPTPNSSKRPSAVPVVSKPIPQFVSKITGANFSIVTTSSTNASVASVPSQSIGSQYSQLEIPNPVISEKASKRPRHESDSLYKIGANFTTHSNSTASRNKLSTTVSQLQHTIVTSSHLSNCVPQANLARHIDPNPRDILPVTTHNQYLQTPPRLGQQTTSQFSLKSIPDVTLPPSVWLSLSLSNSARQLSLASSPLLTLRPPSTIIDNQRMSTPTPFSWHTPEVRPVSDLKSDPASSIDTKDV